MRIRLEKIEVEPNPEIERILDQMSELGKIADTFYWYISPAAKS